MTRRGAAAIAGGVIALAAILAFLRGSGSDESNPAEPAAPAARSEAPRATAPALIPAPPPPAPAEPVDEPPPAPVAVENALVGRVLSSTGAPVAGAEVTLLGELVVRGEAGADDPDSEQLTVATGDDGRFRVAPLRIDLSYSLRVRAEGHGQFACRVVRGEEGPGEGNIGDLTLPAARAIRGSVIESSGKPIARAVVRVVLVDGWGAVLRASFLERRVTADDGGRFRCVDLAPGAYSVRLDSPGLAAVEESVAVHADRDPDGVELVVPSGRRLVIVLVDESGAPVEGEFVSNRGPGALVSLAPLKSDADGRVEFRGLPNREMRFTTHVALGAGEVPKFAPEEIGPLMPDGQEVRVVLRPVSFVRGRVVDDEDRPIHGLQIDPWEGDRWLYSLTTNSRRDGSFEIAVAAGRSLDLRVEGHSSRVEGGNVKSEFTKWRGQLGPVVAPAEGLVLRCGRPPADQTLRVRVTDADGAPIRGALVEWRDDTLHSVETGADGVARCERMIAGRLRVWCRVVPAAPLPKGQLAPASIEVVPEGQLVEMRYRRGAPFTVLVVDPTGAAIPGAQIRLGAPDRSFTPRSGSTDFMGACAFTVEEGLEFDELHVSLKHPDGRWTTRSRFLVDTRPGELVVELEPLR